MEATEKGFDLVQKLLGITALGTEWILWLLVLLSVVSLAVVIERAVFFFKMKVDSAKFVEDATKALSDHNWDALKTLCQSTPNLAAQTMLRGIDARGRGAQAMEESMIGYLIGHKTKLDQGLMILGTLGNNAPFIGLFGTVLGIIIAFHDLALNPQGGASVVMRGISEALIATAVGLMVAIPAVIAYNFFQRLVKRHVTQAESMIKLLVSHKGA
jgi:biopolymer transport protein ExbB/TolQ